MPEKKPQKKSGEEPIEVGEGSVRAFIYHTPKAGYDGWTLVYYDTDGTRRSVFRSTLEAAKLEGETVTTRLAKAQVDVLKLTNSDVAALLKAREILAPTGKDLILACTEYVDAWNLRRQKGNLTPRTVQEAVDDLLEAKKQDGLSERHRAGLRLRLGAFAESFQCSIADITGPLIEDWLRAQQKANKWCGRTRNHYRANISALVSFAKTRNFLPRDWNELLLVSVAQEEDGEIEVFTPEDFKKLLLNTPASLLPLVALGGFSGARPSEICRCDWSDLHWDTGEFFIGKGKVRVAGHRVAPLTENCKRWLEPHRKAKGPLCNYAQPFNGLLKVARRAEVEWKHDGPRHSFVSYRLATTNNLPQVSKETGTNTVTLTRRYCRPVSRRVAEEWFALVP